MKGNRNFFKLVEEDGGKVFWNKIPFKALGENRISFKDREYDIKPIIQAYLTNTKLTTKDIDDDDDRLTIYDKLKKTGFYSMRHRKGVNSARIRVLCMIYQKQ